MEKDRIISQLHRALVVYDKVYSVLYDYDAAKLGKRYLFCRAEDAKDNYYDALFYFMRDYVKPLGKDEAREVCNKAIELFRRDCPDNEHTPDEWIGTIFWGFFDENLKENLADEQTHSN